MFDIGLKIKQLMSERKIDSPALAKKMGKTKQAVYAMIKSEDINTSLLRQLCEIFDVPITYFFTDSDYSQTEVDLLKKEVAELKNELDELKSLSKDTKALDVSMKFFEAAKEMFAYYNQIKGE